MSVVLLYWQQKPVPFLSSGSCPPDTLAYGTPLKRLQVDSRRLSQTQSSVASREKEGGAAFARLVAATIGSVATENDEVVGSAPPPLAS